MNKILNLIAWLYEVFSETEDSLLAEYRLWQRHFVVSMVTIGFLMLVGSLFVPEPEGLPYAPVTGVAFHWLSVALGILMLISIAWFSWATYGLWRFERSNFDS